MSEITGQLDAYLRAANYLTVAQLYLQSNQLLTRPLEARDIKPRLLGHWGTCPGINFTYAHLNRLICHTEANILFVLGPGHGFPALQANLFLEGTLGQYYPEATVSNDGIAYLAKQFSWPGGFPSHTNAGTPGAILEGGELGYSLATAYGAALDNPDLIVACLVGDGEAETGPLAASWQLVRYLDPGTNGAVLPILHLNGAKISQPTTFGRMSNDELRSYFTGLGYEPLIVAGEEDILHERMITVLDSAYRSIRANQAAARNHPDYGPWRMPVILLKTPKGWTGPKVVKGEPIEGTFRSHQIVAPHAKEDPEELEVIERWLRSYRFDLLYTEANGFAADVLALVPPQHLQMGRNVLAFGGESVTKPLPLPEPGPFGDPVSAPGGDTSSSMRQAGAYLAELFRRTVETKNLRFFSPDETTSNKLDDIFTATARSWAAGPLQKGDAHMSPTGRSLELLSEHALQGVMQGYALTGRHGILTSYEAFAPIVTSMVDQYLKFLKVWQETPWRGDIPSLTYILTSSGWRQEHNGFSHQNPGFIDNLLQRYSRSVIVYLPPDANSTLVALRHSLAATNGINVIVAGKTPEPRWLTLEEAEAQFAQGIATWQFASDPDPDLVFLGVGDYMTKECLAAVSLLKPALPQVKLRFVNLSTLSQYGIHSSTLAAHLTADKPVIANFHGYPETLKQLLFRPDVDPRRFVIRGYVEQGSTTTPFDMQVRNGTSRYQLAIEAVRRLATTGVIDATTAVTTAAEFESVLQKHHAYIREHGTDLPEVEEWQWQPRS